MGTLHARRRAHDRLGGHLASIKERARKERARPVAKGPVDKLAKRPALPGAASAA
jgi:hypothetical protein